MTALEIPEELLQHLWDSTGQHWTAEDLERIAHAFPDPTAGIRYGQDWRCSRSTPTGCYRCYTVL